MRNSTIGILNVIGFGLNLSAAILLAILHNYWAFLYVTVAFINYEVLNQLFFKPLDVKNEDEKS